MDQDLVNEVQAVLAPIRNRIWVEKGSEENIALADTDIQGAGRNLGRSG
jgi:hypothetical protein